MFVEPSRMWLESGAVLSGDIRVASQAARSIGPSDGRYSEGLGHKIRPLPGDYFSRSRRQIAELSLFTASRLSALSPPLA